MQRWIYVNLFYTIFPTFSGQEQCLQRQHACFLRHDVIMSATKPTITLINQVRFIVSSLRMASPAKFKSSIFCRFKYFHGLAKFVDMQHVASK